MQRDGRAQTAVAKILKPFIGLGVVTSIGLKNEQQKQLGLFLFIFQFLPALTNANSLKILLKKI